MSSGMTDFASELGEAFAYIRDNINYIECNERLIKREHDEAIDLVSKLEAREGWSYWGIKDNCIISYSKGGVFISYDVRDSRRHKPYIIDEISCCSNFDEAMDYGDNILLSKNKFSRCFECQSVKNHNDFDSDYLIYKHFKICLECVEVRTATDIEDKKTRRLEIKQNAKNRYREKRKTQLVLSLINTLRSRQNEK